MKARFTKRAFNDIFNYLRDDGDFCDLFREYWGKKTPINRLLNAKANAIYANDSSKQSTMNNLTMARLNALI